MPMTLLAIDKRASVLAFLAGLLGAAAFPPIGFGPLILISIGAWLYLVRDGDAAQARNLGLFYGLAFAPGTMYWLFSVFGPLAFSLMGLMAAYFGLLGTLVGWSKSVPPFRRTFCVAMFAVGVEWLRGDAWYLRFPWYTPPHALATFPAWIASARWFGTYGLSFAIWWLAGATVFVNRRFVWAVVCLPAAAWLLPTVASPDRIAVLVQGEGTAEVEAVVPQIPAQRADLAVLPEIAYLCSPDQAIQSRNGPGVLADKLNCPVVFGAIDGEYGTVNFYNLAVVMDADKRIVGTFPKHRPVPLFLDGRPGDRTPVFALEQGVIGAAICYDFDAPSIAASLARKGATVFALPTYDAISWTATQHVNHELLVRLRAVENDRWILRTASSGRSEVIDPRGVPSSGGVEIGETGFAVLPFAHRRSFALGSWLDWLGPAFASGTLCYVLARWMTKWKTPT